MKSTGTTAEQFVEKAMSCSCIMKQKPFPQCAIIWKLGFEMRI
jgi:hypothetical protein